jgi:hypothetical protein
MATDTQNANATDDVTQDDAASRDGGGVGAGQATQTQAQQAPPTPEETRSELEREKAEKARLQKVLNETNRRAAADRKRLEDIDRQEQERKAAQLSDSDRARQEAEETAQRLRDAERERDEAKQEALQVRISLQVEREAREIGFKYPEDVCKLIDADRIEVDENGKISGVKEAVKRLAADRPGLLVAPPTGGSPAAMTTRRPGSGPSGQANAGQQQAVDIEAEMRRAVRYPA